MKVYKFEDGGLDDIPYIVTHNDVPCRCWATVYSDELPFNMENLLEWHDIKIYAEEARDGRIWLDIDKGDLFIRNKLMPTTDLEEAKRIASFIYDILGGDKPDT